MSTQSMPTIEELYTTCERTKAEMDRLRPICAKLEQEFYRKINKPGFISYGEPMSHKDRNWHILKIREESGYRKAIEDFQNALKAFEKVVMLEDAKRFNLLMKNILITHNAK